MSRIALALALATASGLAAEPASPKAPPLADLLAQAAGYARRYDLAFSDVSAEETYVQKSFLRRRRLAETRTLRSDMVFVRLGGDLRWTVFRDVFEVDGKPVRDREARLETLFSGSEMAVATAKAQEILNESARYNIGRVPRNFNTPTLALVFLQAENQHRFRFKRKGASTIDGVPAWGIEYEEQKHPAFIGDREGHDLLAKGTIWVAAAEGRVLRSEMRVKDARGAYQVDVTVEFGPWPGQGVWVPREMRELCTYLPRVGPHKPRPQEGGGPIAEPEERNEHIETVASYFHYRPFLMRAPEAFGGVQGGLGR